MKKLILSILFTGLLFAVIGCSKEGTDTNQEMNEVNSLELYQQLQVIAASANTAAKSSNGKKPDPKPHPTVWVDCEKYSAIVVPATFKPTSHAFDELYMIPSASFYMGIPLVSDSKPGDKDYNGGRWHLNVIKEGVDASKYNMVCMEEDIDPDDFESTDMYFECPILPFRE